MQPGSTPSGRTWELPSVVLPELPGSFHQVLSQWFRPWLNNSHTHVNNQDTNFIRGNLLTSVLVRSLGVMPVLLLVRCWSEETAGLLGRGEKSFRVFWQVQVKTVLQKGEKMCCLVSRCVFAVLILVIFSLPFPMWSFALCLYLDSSWGSMIQFFSFLRLLILWILLKRAVECW